MRESQLKIYFTGSCLKIYSEVLETVIDGIKIDRGAWKVRLGSGYKEPVGYFSGVIDEFRITDGLEPSEKEPESEFRLIGNRDKDSEILKHFRESLIRDEAGNEWEINERECGVRTDLEDFNYKESAYFDGKSRIRYLSSLMTGRKDFLIEFCIRLEKAATNGTSRIVMFFNDEDTFKDSIQIYLTEEKKLKLAYLSNRGQLESKSYLDENTWTKVSYLFKRDLNLIILYINGREDGIVYKKIEEREFKNVIIGHSGFEGSEVESYFQGNLEDFRVTEISENNFDLGEDYYFERYPNLPIEINSYTKSCQKFTEKDLRDSAGGVKWEFNRGESAIHVHLDESFIDFYSDNNWTYEGYPELRSAPARLFDDELITYAYFNQGDSYWLKLDNKELKELFSGDFRLSFFIYLTDLDNQGFLSAGMTAEGWTGIAVTCIDRYIRFSAAIDGRWSEFNLFKAKKNIWMNISIIKKGNILAGYLDGKQVRKIELEGSIRFNENELILGYWGGYLKKSLKGFMREVSIDRFSFSEEVPLTIPVQTSVKDILWGNLVRSSSGIEFILNRNQYLERSAKIGLTDSFTIEVSGALEPNQVLFSLANDVDNLTLLSGFNENELIVKVYGLEIKVPVERIREFNRYVVQVERGETESEFGLRINGESKIDIPTDRIMTGLYRLNIGSDYSVSNGLKGISEFRLMTGIHTNLIYSGYRDELTEVSDSDLIHIYFNSEEFYTNDGMSYIRDESGLANWRIEGNDLTSPSIIEGIYSRFGGAARIPGGTSLEVTNNDRIYFFKEFSLDFWLISRCTESLTILTMKNSQNELKMTVQGNSLKVHINDLVLSGILKKKMNLIALEYYKGDIILYINGLEVSRLINQIIFSDEYLQVIKLGDELNREEFLLDEFRYSSTARFKGKDFLPPIKPFSQLEYKKSLMIREGTVIKSLPLFYDKPELGYSIYDSEDEITVYSELIPYYSSSGLISRVSDSVYRSVDIEGEEIFGFEFRVNLESGLLEYLDDDLEFKPIGDLIYTDSFQTSSILFIYQDIELEEKGKKIYSETKELDGYLVIKLSSIQRENYKVYIRYFSDSCRTTIQFGEGIEEVINRLNIEDLTTNLEFIAHILMQIAGVER